MNDHYNCNNVLFQDVGLLAQSLAALCKCLLLFRAALQQHILTGSVPSYPTQQSFIAGAPKIQQILALIIISTFSLFIFFVRFQSFRQREYHVNFMFRLRH